MEASYIYTGEGHYQLMLGFESFLTLKALHDAGYQLKPYYYTVDSCHSNSDLVGYIFKTIWGQKNVLFDQMEVDGYDMDLYRIKIPSIENISTKTLKEIKKIIKKAVLNINSIENSDYYICDEKLIEAWYITKDGFEILTHPVNIEYSFVKEILIFINELREIIQEEI